MVDAYTGTSALSNLVTGSVDQYVRAQLRHAPLLRNVADVRPAMPDKPGSSIQLFKHSDLPVATTPLTELTDPDFVALPNPTAVTLTPAEYGNATISTIKANVTSFADIDPYQMNLVAYNMRDTLDVLVRDVLSAGTNVRYGSAGATDPAATVDIAAEDTIASADIRYVVAKLRANAAQGRFGDNYWCGIHPDVAHDLKAESGSGSWREAHIYSAPGVIWPNVIGQYEGAVFVESARMKSAADGASSRTVYRTILCGAEALAEGVQVEPGVRVGVVPDRLNRFFPLGWYGYLGWVRFREEALYRIESSSSITP